MNVYQRKHLEERMSSVRRACLDTYDRAVEKSDPPAIAGLREQIRALHRRIAKFDNARQRVKERLRKRLDRDIMKIRSKFLFGDPVAALKMVERFEKRMKL